jgi:hypothetical protein
MSIRGRIPLSVLRAGLEKLQYDTVVQARLYFTHGKRDVAAVNDYAGHDGQRKEESQHTYGKPECTQRDDGDEDHHGFSRDSVTLPRYGLDVNQQKRLFGPTPY